LDIKECVKIEEEEEGCWDTSECPEGMECKGANYRTVWVQEKWPLGHLEKRGDRGICVAKYEGVIKIKGITDFKTCDYCLSMIGRTFREGKGEAKLPPYHKHCRCWSEVEG